MIGPRLPYGSWEHRSLDTPPPMYSAVTGHGLKLASSTAWEELQTGGACAGWVGRWGVGWGTIHMDPQAHAGEARGGNPTKTEVRQGEVMVCMQPGQLCGVGAETAQGPQSTG